jgi:hypothetical protein
MRSSRNPVGLAVAIAVVCTLWVEETKQTLVAQGAAKGPNIPKFEVDPSWPPKLPNNWVMGVPSFVAVDRHDHVWVLQHPRTAPADQRANVAPAVIEFDPSGKFVNAWGGPGQGYDWPDTEHGIFIDYKDRVWITGINPLAGRDVSTRSDDMILKFTSKGQFLQQIGGRDVSGGNKDTKNPKQSAEVFVPANGNEAYVADGYGNRRVWIIDSETGAFKRMWGAFGKTPLDPLLRARLASWYYVISGDSFNKIRLERKDLVKPKVLNQSHRAAGSPCDPTAVSLLRRSVERSLEAGVRPGWPSGSATGCWWWRRHCWPSIGQRSSTRCTGPG